MIEYSLFGLLFALVFYAISVTPLTLPRRWWWHAFVSGILSGFGYALGWGLEIGVKALLGAIGVTIAAPEAVWAWGKSILIVLVVAWTLRSVWQSYRTSQEASRLVEMKPVGPGEYLIGLAASFVMFAFVMLAVNLVVEIFIRIVWLLNNWIPVGVAVAIAIVAVVVIIFVVSNKVVFKSLMALYARKAASLNTTSATGYDQPVSPLRSGSPSSLVPWEQIGGQGRKFIGKGPGQPEIEAVTGQPAVEPIRIYVGMPADNTDLSALADLAVADLERAGGFERAVILVNTATGSGWVDEWLVQPLEYLTRGDCAVVTMQYSYLFSAALLVSNVEVCAEAGTILFEKVEARAKQIPADRRPLLIASGESLGALGSQAPFADADDLNRRVDGAIWTGSPHDSKLLREATDNRHQGSPEVAPVYQNGRHIRFANEPKQLTADRFGRELGRWDFPRSVFIQHASDPVVWYTPRLMVWEPDWIRERAGIDMPPVNFTPFATFLQLLSDLPVAGTAPAGHGHTYHREVIDAWTRVLGFDQEVALGRLGETSWLTDQVRADIGDAVEENDQLDP